VVKGSKLDKLIVMTNFAQPDSWDRFRRVLRTIGVDKALKKAGAVEGSMVRILNKEFEWSDAPLPSAKPGKFAYKYKKKGIDYSDQ
jgi:GTP-binding protein